MSTVVIGITGPSCSGKTTLSRAVAAMLPDAVHLKQDLYFRDPVECPPDANFCELRWLHVDEFVDDFLSLATGGQASVPEVDFKTFRRHGHRPLGPARHLIVEGMTIFRISAIYGNCDFRYYVDCDFPTLVRRKWERDTRERGKSESIVEAQLTWMKSEYESDSTLRAELGVSLVTADDITRIVDLATW